MFIVYDGCIMVPIEDAIYPKKGRKLPDVSLTAPAPVCLGAADVSLTALTLYGLSSNPFCLCLCPLTSDALCRFAGLPYFLFF